MKTTFVCLGFAAGMLLAGAALAGGDGPMVEAPGYKEDLIQISIPEAEVLKSKGWKFYDVNTLEIWADGFIPGATFFNVQDWKKLLPADKNTPMVFYCANRLCESSENAARQVIRLGYTQVRQMPDGIYGWKLSGRATERP